MKKCRTGNYFCTWLSQYKTQPTYEAGCDVTNVRDKMDSSLLWGERGLLLAIDERVRGDITVLLDDGWDVPYGTSSEPQHRDRFGKFYPDKNRFPEFVGTPTERLRGISEKVKSLGFFGLGVWMCCNLTEENENGEKHIMTAEEARHIWEKRARDHASAGVVYWKVDWGYHDRDPEYRKMITEVAKEFAPEISVEHSFMQSCFNTQTSTDYRDRIGEVLSVSDFIRTYDCVEEFTYPITIARLAEILSADYTEKDGCRAIPNIEDALTLGAVAGCSLGIMRHKHTHWNELCLDRADVAHRADEVARSLIWQRFSPPFGVKESYIRISEKTLTDTWHFDVHPLDWTYKLVGGKTLTCTSPAIIARGTDLPTAENDNNSVQEIPFLAASHNPKTNVFSIGALPRTKEGCAFYEPRARVTANAKNANVIGVFGDYQTLSLRFAESIIGKRVYMADILALAEVHPDTDDFSCVNSDSLHNIRSEKAFSRFHDVTANVRIEENTLYLDGELLHRIGGELSRSNDRSPHACVIVISE